MRVVLMVVREGMAVAMWRLAIGVGAAVWLTQWMRSLLVGVQPLDPVSFLVGPAVLLGVALVACVIPARNAASTDPLIALRSE